MAYDEFLNVFLPAANQGLRDYCLYGYRTPGYYKSPLPIQISSMAVRILEREKNLQRKREEIKRELFKHVDYQKHKAFHELGNGQMSISMSDLIYYLEQNGFHPRTEELEAILRRCDHDADRYLSFEEFCELTESPGEEGDAQDPEDKPSPEKKEMEEDIKEGSPAKRRNSNHELDAKPKEDMDEQMERREYEAKLAQEKKEHEERMAEYKKEQEKRYALITKVVDFYQGQASAQASLNYQKEILSNLQAFDAEGMFRDMDKDREGFITVEKIQTEFEGVPVADTIKAWNLSGLQEGQINLRDWESGFKPHQPESDRRQPVYGIYSPYNPRPLPRFRDEQQ